MSDTSIADDTIASGENSEEPSVSRATVSEIDPRAPRFGQTLTAVLTFAGIITTTPELVALVAIALAIAVVSGWRIDPWSWLWRYAAVRAVEPPETTEPAPPHRFAKVIGALVTTAGAVCLYAGLPAIGYAFTAIVAVLAGLAAVTGICVGCRFYRQFAFARRLNLI